MKSRGEVIDIIEMSELSTIKYTDLTAKLAISCFADTFVFNKRSNGIRELVAMRFGGYSEQVRAMVNAMRMGVAIQADIDNHPIVLKAVQKNFRRSVTHDGNYAVGMVMAYDDEIGADSEDEKQEKKVTGFGKCISFAKKAIRMSYFQNLIRKQLFR